MAIFKSTNPKVRKKLAAQFSERTSYRVTHRRKLKNGRMVIGKGLARVYPDIIYQ